ncbi:hypothetical protein MBAV_001586 [Candidatus Magnetobacterium bavaricum]|uniref:Uncharacterized protein n=1 Tax=Candidatus Magnetobacterium bavaricum TaxID=29290 RepID=A0A0F3GW74_9BACT|nr:hypothetical protein MBAV_001586 [Candidatus Magnetobacterium bavaricum]
MMKNIVTVILILMSFGLVKPQSFSINTNADDCVIVTLDVCSNDAFGGVFDNYADSFCEKIFSLEMLESVAFYFPLEKHRYQLIQSSIKDRPPEI